MNDQMKKFWQITSSVLVLIIMFVPYIKEVCTSRGCNTSGSGYTFVGNLGFGEQINIPLLLIEIVIVLVISGSYYYFAIKNK